MEKYKVREGCVIRSSLLLTLGIISQAMRRADCPLHVHLCEIQVIIYVHACIAHYRYFEGWGRECRVPCS